MSTIEFITGALRSAGIQTPPITERLARSPEPICGFDVEADEAIATWERLREATEQTGLYPVLIADEHDILGANGNPAPPPASETLTLAAAHDGARWLRRMAEHAMAEYESDGDSPEGAQPSDTFAAPYDLLTGEPRSGLYMALLPTRTPWEAAAHLSFEAVNYDLEPHHHVAAHKYWFEKYGAELVTCGGDFIEFKVARPPEMPEAAMELAREQYGYCIDIVAQGTGSVEALAATLLNGRVWFFWWD